VRTLPDIQQEIDALSERRAELWRLLGGGLDTAAASELKEIDERLAALWQEQRQLRARVRFGEREKIVARARAEERLERSEYGRRAA
jgi:hypothetical protein